MGEETVRRRERGEITNMTRRYGLGMETGTETKMGHNEKRWDAKENPQDTNLSIVYRHTPTIEQHW